MTPSKTLFYLCLSFILGIFFASIISLPKICLFGIFVLGGLIIMGSFLFKKDAVVILGFCLLVLVLGMMRFQISEFTVAHDTLSKFNDTPDKITLVGFISAEPDVRETSKKIKVTVQKIAVGDKQFHVASNVLVTLNNYGKSENYQYLDQVTLTGKLKTPVIFEDFNYKNYLMKDGIYSVMDFPDVQILPAKHRYTIFSYAYEKILELKSALLQGVAKNLSPPHSFVLQGMVFGDDKHVSKELKNKFNVTGLSHVTAVSGSNIVIIINMIMVFLLAIGFWRGQAFYLAVAFIWIYIILIGFPASGVRAAIMGCAVLLAGKVGRQSTGSRTITLAAVVMLLQNPMLLLYDIGFQLSFLASLGIIYLRPLIDIFFKIITGEHLKFWRDLVAITLAAQIITLPIIMYNFGTVSVIAPIANLFGLPAVEALTIFGFLLAICGAIVPPLGFIFGLPCWLLLNYFLWVLDVFAKPWAVASVPKLSWVLILIYYAILFAIIKFFQKFQKPKFLGY